MSLYRSERGLFDFQAEGIAQWIETKGLICAWDAGTGKSHLALAGISFMFDSGMLGENGIALIVCENNKLQEWESDFLKFTGLRTVRYEGTVKKRAKILDSVGGPDGPQVLIMSYGISRQDLGKFQNIKEGGRAKKVWANGPLHKKVTGLSADNGLAIVYDESSRVGGGFSPGHRRKGRGWTPQRGSVLYKAHSELLKDVRSQTDRVWVAGLNATPVERDPESIWNQMRLCNPRVAGSTSSFEKDHVRWIDHHGRKHFKNIGSSEEPWVTSLAEKLSRGMSVKKKTDPDVAKNFPSMSEEPIYVTMTKDHADLYRAVEGLVDDPELFPGGMDDKGIRTLYGVLRQVASHPMALALSESASKEGTLANTIVERVGVPTLESIRCSREDILIEKLKALIDQGSQVIVFTFFGQTTLPILSRRMESEGISHQAYHGQMSAKDREDAIEDFRAGRARVLLSSDAGSRGLNIPEASYVVNYELCLTHARTVQRVNRISRIDSGHSAVTAYSLVAVDTIEERIFQANIQRQEWHEDLVSGEDDDSSAIGMLPSGDRERLFGKARMKATG